MVGAPRSGTYWVVDLLQSRFQIQFPSETHFIPLFSRYLWLWGDLSWGVNRRRLLLNIYEFLQIWTVRSSSSDEYRLQIRQLSLLATLDAGRAQAIVNESHDYPTLVSALFRHFAELHGVDASGDKSAHYLVTDPDVTFGLFPEALMLHVIRDGRDVALSWMRQWFGPTSLRNAARLWRDHVEVNRAWGRRNAARYLEIRYEDLAADKEAQIRKLEAFLEITAVAATSGAGQSALAQALSKTESHSAMLDIVASENVAKWRSEMSAPDVACFEQIAGGTLSACGYPLSGAGGAGARHPNLRFSTHKLRLFAKSVLPLVLGLSARLGISMLGLINRRFPREWRAVRMDSSN
jgi:hypothetical protein